MNFLFNFLFNFCFPKNNVRSYVRSYVAAFGNQLLCYTVGVMCAVLVLSGCVGGFVSGPGVSEPTLDTLPDAINKVQLVVGGKKTSGTLVFVSTSNSADALKADGALDDSAWSATIVLSEGENTVSVFASDAKEKYFSKKVGPVTVTLDTTIAAPVLVTPTSPTGSAELVLTGTRDADANLCLRINQETDCTEVVGMDGSTDFAVTKDASLGNNVYCFSSTDHAGNVSAEACVTVLRLQGPHVDVISPVTDGTVIGTILRVKAAVTAAGSDAADVVSGVSICCGDSACVAATYNSLSGYYEGDISIGTVTDGSDYVCTVKATNSSTITTEVRVNLVYRSGAISVLSDQDTAAASTDVAFALSGETLHIVWTDQCSNTASCPFTTHLSNIYPGDILYRSYSGGSFSPTQLLSDSSQDGVSSNPCITVDTAGDIHIAWAEAGTIAAGDNDTAADIVSRSITGADGTLGDIAVVAHSANQVMDCALAGSADGSVHLVWSAQLSTDNTDYDIFYSRWGGSATTTTTALTKSWSAALLVSDHGNDGVSIAPSITTNSNSVAYVAWQETGSFNNIGVVPDIHLRSVTAGDTLGAIKVVTDSARDGISSFPKIATDSDDIIHIVWQDNATLYTNTTAEKHIWYRRYNAVTDSFTPYEQFSIDGGAESPVLALTPSGSVVVSWSRLLSGGNADTFYRILKGGLLGTVQNSSIGTPLLSYNVQVVVSAAGDLHVGWEDSSDYAGSGTDTDVLWRIYPASSNWENSTH